MGRKTGVELYDPNGFGTKLSPYLEKQQIKKRKDNKFDSRNFWDGSLHNACQTGLVQRFYSFL
jgi:hypothetical protein